MKNGWLLCLAVSAKFGWVAWSRSGHTQDAGRSRYGNRIIHPLTRSSFMVKFDTEYRRKDSTLCDRGLRFFGRNRSAWICSKWRDEWLMAKATNDAQTRTWELVGE
jgi:hypothetical protein